MALDTLRAEDWEEAYKALFLGLRNLWPTVSFEVYVHGNEQHPAELHRMEVAGIPEDALSLPLPLLADWLADREHPLEERARRLIKCTWRESTSSHRFTGDPAADFPWADLAVVVQERRLFGRQSWGAVAYGWTSSHFTDLEQARKECELYLLLMAELRTIGGFKL